MRIKAEAGKGKLAHIDATDGNHAGCFQSLHYIGIILRRLRIGEHDRSGRRRQAGNGKEILPGNRNAIQQPARTPFAQPLGRSRRLFLRACLKQPRENRLILVGPDRIQRLLGQRYRIETAGLDQDRQLRDRFAEMCLCHRPCSPLPPTSCIQRRTR